MAREDEDEAGKGAGHGVGGDGSGNGGCRGGVEGRDYGWRGGVHGELGRVVVLCSLRDLQGVVRGRIQEDVWGPGEGATSCISCQ